MTSFIHTFGLARLSPVMSCKSRCETQESGFANSLLLSEQDRHSFSAYDVPVITLTVVAIVITAFHVPFARCWF